MSKSITVLKFGGSVLQDEGDLAKAVHEIYKHWRQGSHVVAVVSAFNGRTDELLSKANAFSDDPHAESVSSLLLTGETESASLLCMELDRSGIPAKFLTAHQLGLVTKGERLDSKPVSLDSDRLRSEISTSVVVVSGFGGVDESGGATLLGRGGSDYTALFIAERMDARCILVKDTNGLYESDPNASGPKPRRLETASYTTALGLGGGVIQEKAIHFAERNALPIEIAALNCVGGTTIGDLADAFYTNDEKARRTRVALFGCGTVGGGVFTKLSELTEQFEVVGITNLRTERARAAGVPEALIVPTVHELLSVDTDVVIELIGGIEPARSLVENALSSGKSVVTANKALIAKHGIELQKLASENGVRLAFSASVGGVMPALEAVTNAVEPIAKLSGILNGTCNFICGELSKGKTFESSLELAQAKGFAEADPTLDIDGSDAAQKLILLVRKAFNEDIDFRSIDREGVEHLTSRAFEDAALRGNTIRLVATCTRHGDELKAKVRLIEVPLAHPFAQIHGAENCLSITDADGCETIIRGRGAGRYPTTEAVIADLLDIRYQHSTKEKALAARVKI